MVRFIHLKRYCWLLFALSRWQKQDFIGKDSRLWHPNRQHFQLRAEGNWFRWKCWRLHSGEKQRWNHFELWRATMHSNANKFQWNYQQIQQKAKHVLQDLWDGQEEFGSKCDSFEERIRKSSHKSSTYPPQHILDVVKNTQKSVL